MNKISIRVLIVGLLIFCFKSFAQTPVEIHQGGSVVSTSNPFYVTFSGDIEIDTAILQDILEQLEKNTYTGDYLNVRFNNTTIGATQSGTWNIGSITTLPSVTIGSMPAVTASNLDIRDLTSASDSVKVEGGNSSAVKVDGSAVTQPISGTVGTSTTLVRKESSQDLSAAALDYTTNFAAKTKIMQVFLHASTNISETVTISFNSTTSANYDTIIKSETLSTEANVAWIPDNFVLLSGDEITVTCTNGGGTGTVYVTVIGETLN